MTLTNPLEIFSALSEPFPPEDIEWKPQSPHQKGEEVTAMALPYLDARAIMDRLDTVVGPENWYDEYEAWADGKGTKASLHIRVAGEWITKQDVAENPTTEGIKGGVSNALKRVAVKWGIGRYLYSLPKYWVKAQWVGEPARKQCKLIEFPLKRLPAWALPKDYKMDGENFRKAIEHYGNEESTPPAATGKGAPKPAQAEKAPAGAAEKPAEAAEKAAETKAPAAGKPAGKPAAEVVNKAQVTAVSVPPDEKNAKALARAREYVIPAGVPLGGTKLGDAVSDAFGNGVVRYLAGLEANPTGQTFAPQDDAGKSLQAAAKFLLSNNIN